jgi:hypothetical protein
MSMNNKKVNNKQTDRIHSLRIRTGIRAGDWSCTNCQGQVNGNTMLQAACGTCQSK